MAALCCIYIAAYALSAGPVGWCYVGEIATPPVCAKTAGMATFFSSGFGLLWSYTVPLILSPQGSDWGLKSGFFWGGTSTIALVLIYFFVPETKGRTFYELDEMFEAKIPARKFSTFKTAADRARDTRENVQEVA